MEMSLDKTRDNIKYENIELDDDADGLETEVFHSLLIVIYLDNN